MFEGLPREFRVYYDYLQNLRFEDKPDYQFLRTIFSELYHRQGYVQDRVFDWTWIPVRFERPVTVSSMIPIYIDDSELLKLAHQILEKFDKKQNRCISLEDD